MEDFDFKLQPGQKLERSAKPSGKPLISIATAYYNCKDYIMQTANSILNQTFPFWEWNIVNDGSKEEGTKEILEKLEKLDSRIHVINQENAGRLVARDNAVKKAKADLVFILDSDDVIDKTYLECAYFTMLTNPDATWAYADTVTFDGQEFLWKKLFDCEEEKKENLLPVCALIKKQAILDVGGYAKVDKDVHEDWHMWLRMIEKGLYPVRMNFYGFWYRSKKEGGTMASIKNDASRQNHAEEEIKKQAKKIKHNVTALQYPMTTNFDFDSYPYVFDWDREKVNVDDKKNLLFIFPWFKLGGADKFNYDLLSSIDRNKYNITILTTEPCEYVWRQKFEKFGEVFDLTSFLHRRDWPAFIHYIMKSRSIDLVFESQSYFGYYVIPWLKSYFPEVPFVDYIHAENWGWRNGEYPRDSTGIAGLLDRTYTCTKYLKSEMETEMGRTTDNVLPVYIGVDETEFDETKVNIEDDEDLKEVYDKYKDMRKILYCCRISIEKRPILALKILNKLCSENSNTVLFVVGNGPNMQQMKKEASKLGLQKNIVFFGSKNDVKPFYKACDVELICSLSEGLTLTTYEAMAMKRPVVSANVGGQKELIDNTCGRIVDNIQKQQDLFIEDYSEEEIDRYAKALNEILDSKNYEEMKENARKKILNGFTIGNMKKIMTKEIEELTSNKSKVGLDSPKYREMYSQYLVLYNQLDQRTYFSDKGGIGVDGNFYEEKTQRLKDQLWKNPAWRGFIKFLQKTGIMKAAKKAGVDRKIKEKVAKNLK